MTTLEQVWVFEGKIGKKGSFYEELILVNKDTIPDGVGFATRAEAKAWRKRKPNDKPIWAVEKD